MKQAFLSAWLRNPLQMGAVVPSGRGLADAMAAQIDGNSGLVLELGAGTGVVTRALLARGLVAEQLLVVEKDRSLAEAVARQFPTLSVIVGDATRLKALLRHPDRGPVDVAVSSLPLLGMRNFTRTRIIAQIFSVLRPGGKLVQFTYSPKPPIPKRLTEVLDIKGERVDQILWNFPPANVWIYRCRG